MFEYTLDAGQLGARVLVRIAHDKLSGKLHWMRSDSRLYLEFVHGELKSLSDAKGITSRDRKHLIAVLRTCAASTVGRCIFDIARAVDHPEKPTASAPVSNEPVDTLGETLMGIMTHTSDADVHAFCEARGDDVIVSPTPAFRTLVSSVSVMAKQSFGAPKSGTTVRELMQQTDVIRRRGWMALLLLDAFKVQSSTKPLERAKLDTDPRAIAHDDSVSSDPTIIALVAEIKTAHARHASQNHYEFLGIPMDAKIDIIRKAYFKQAKLWHSDRFAGKKLGAAATLANELFMRSEEANRTLSDAKERTSYDWVIARKAQGLPTDPTVVMQAENLFVQGQQWVRQGHAAKAEPVLRQAVALNKGEAEFLAYLGFAIYAAHGKEGLAEAHACLERALLMRRDLDVIHEFLGKIARVEGDAKMAAQHFKAALAINPDNADAQREMRLADLRMTETRPTEVPTSGTRRSLLQRLFKRS